MLERKCIVVYPVALTERGIFLAVLVACCRAAAAARRSRRDPRHPGQMRSPSASPSTGLAPGFLLGIAFICVRGIRVGWASDVILRHCLPNLTTAAESSLKLLNDAYAEDEPAQVGIRPASLPLKLSVNCPSEVIELF